MDRHRQKPMIAWLTVALLLGVQAWVGYHKAADHHHPHHSGHDHAHTQVPAPIASLFLQLQAIVAHQIPSDHSHDDHPPHRDEDHEITWAPLRKSAADTVFTTAFLPVLGHSPKTRIIADVAPLSEGRATPLRPPLRSCYGRAPPLIFVA